MGFGQKAGHGWGIYQGIINLGGKIIFIWIFWGLQLHLSNYYPAHAPAVQHVQHKNIVCMVSHHDGNQTNELKLDTRD